MLLLPLLLLIPPALAHTASLYFPSIPEDLYAFPKHRVSFVNGLYLTNETAHRWLTDGLPGGEDEFLGRDWKSKSITGQEDASTSALQELNIPGQPNKRPVTLQPMKLGPNTSYLCLIPSPPLATSFSSQGDKAPISRSPAKSWELLQPMSQGCLYHVLGWFTYAYCHGKYVKQFREAPHTHPHPPGGRIPEEDPEWESYFLGVAPHRDSTELVTAEDVAAANKLELARGAGQRYLVQRWEDGTVCDKTGAPRKVEVQVRATFSIVFGSRSELGAICSIVPVVSLLHDHSRKPPLATTSWSSTPLAYAVSQVSNRNETHKKRASYAAAKSSTNRIKRNMRASPALKSQRSKSRLQPAPILPHPSLVQPRPQRGPPSRQISLVQPQKLLSKLPVVDPDPQAASASSATPAATAAATGGTETTTTGAATATGKKQDGKKDHAQLLRRALQALLRQPQEDGAPAADGGDNDGNDDAGDGASALFGSEDVIAVDGEDGQKVFLFVDNLDELDGLDLVAAVDDAGAGADGVRLEDDDAGRLTAMRRKLEEQRKLLESLTSTLSKAARRRAPLTTQRTRRKNKMTARVH
ncbi:hypothetical protein BS47DRAFT_1381777 [Hydnum rufescens UP504]|uniref:Protein OS-9 homolog n=1 Tax=Hydnum rufescens UP504 TaxID=1448309 RepID=A0A9P6AZG7_9AGAM|nr:hypothetical protein BS47DRAFT_1381777 [Hydnum rufescens UP504]